MFLPQENNLKILFILLFLKVKWGIYWELLLGYVHINRVCFVTELGGQQASGLAGLPCKFCPLQLVTSGSFSRDSEMPGLPDIHRMVSPQSPVREWTVLGLIPPAKQCAMHT